MLPVALYLLQPDVDVDLLLQIYFRVVYCHQHDAILT